MDRISKLSKKSIQFFTWEAIQAWILPLLSVPLTILIGWFQDVPWFYVYVATGFMFAMCTTGLLRFSEWRFRVTTKDKISFAHLEFAKKFSSDGFISAIALGFRVKNEASFPIQFAVHEMNSQLKDSFPPKKDYEQSIIIIPPNGSGWFCDHYIDVREFPKEKMVTDGLISVYIKYGRVGNLSQEMKFSRKVFVEFDGQGEAKITGWHDL